MMTARVIVSHDVRQFPILFCLSVAATLLGASLMIEPALSASSPTLAIMPLWGVLLWGVMFFAGGIAAAYGLRRGRLDYESAGCTLQGFAYMAAAFVSALSATPSPLGITFLGALAIGFTWRGFLLTRGR